MDEKIEKKQEDKKEEPKQEDTKSPIEEARELVEQIKQQNAEFRELVTRQENLKSRELLGGKTEAGTGPEQKDPETERKERLNQLLKGTGLQI